MITILCIIGAFACSVAGSILGAAGATAHAEGNRETGRTLTVWAGVPDGLALGLAFLAGLFLQ